MSASPAARPPEPPPIYAIADREALGGRSLVSAMATMAECGVRWIQLRAKQLPDDELYRLAEACCRRLEGSGAALWINDRPDLAALLPVAGVHVGQDDLPPSAARRAVGRGLWLGLSTHGEAQLAEADRDPEVDLIALGPIFATTGKREPDPVVGLERLRRCRGRTRKPLVAIGGIGPENVARVLAAGADSVAVLGAVCRGEIERNCRRLLAAAGEAA
jgi:thiamine-phosphate pyrophosphorylase